MYRNGMDFASGRYVPELVDQTSYREALLALMVVFAQLLNIGEK
jgi:hypothetical protein